MVTDQRNPRPEADDRIVGAQVVGPKEGLLAQLDGCREETEHSPQDRELEKHRQTSAHRADPGPLVEIHLGLLLLERVLLLRVLLVQLVDLRLDGLHLGRGRVGLVGERKHDNLYEYGHQEDDDTKVGDEPVEEVEQRDDHESGEPAHEPTTQWNDLLVLLAIGLQGLEMVRAEIELERNHGLAMARFEIHPHPGLTGHQVVALVILREIVECEIRRGELLRSPHDGREELLLEGEPRHLGVDTFLRAATLGDGLRLLLAVEIVVELGVLDLILVALLHPRHGHEIVHIEREDILGNDILHTDKREIVLN